MIKHTNDSLRELVQNWTKDTFNVDIIREIEEADHFVLKLDINLISKTSEVHYIPKLDIVSSFWTDMSRINLLRLI